MNRYDATEDPLCYPGTQVLKNKLGLTDQDELDQFEQLMFLTRSDEALPGGDLEFPWKQRGFGSVNPRHGNLINADLQIT